MFHFFVFEKVSVELLFICILVFRFAEIFLTFLSLFFLEIYAATVPEYFVIVLTELQISPLGIFIGIFFAFS